MRSTAATACSPTFMLGANGDSNGCVSFRDYYAFLDAYRNKGIRKLAVLAKVD